MTNIFIKSNKTKGEVKEVRLVPTNLGYYKVEIVTTTEVKEPIISDNFVGIDLGINNLISLASNNPNIPSVIINGRQIKSINAFYNKKISKLKKQLPENIYTSKRIKHITRKRNNKISDYFHKTSKLIVGYFVSKNISEIVIGKNDNWKNSINIGKRNNQNFCSIAHDRLITMIRYKCEIEGISVTTREESYTSKCSFLDMEDIKKSDAYIGKRKKRGLFVSGDNVKINADINGALNILRKEKGNDVFKNTSNPIRVFAVSPVKINVPLRGTLKLAK